MSTVFHGITAGRAYGKPGAFLHELVAAGSTLLDGLVSWWDLDETSGTREDAVGESDLTDNNTVLYTAGKIGNAASFVQANNEWLGASGLKPTGFSTFAFWVYVSGTYTTYNYIFRYDDAGGAYMRYRPSDGQVRAGGYDSEATFSFTSSNDASLTAGWHLFMCWVDDSTFKMTHSVDNGTPVVASTALNSGGLANGRARGMEFGGYGVGVFDGAIDLAGVWDRNLTANERTELYNAGASIRNDFSDNGEGFREGLVSYWKMEEESGTRYNSDKLMSEDLQTGLVSFWELDEESGTRYDSVGSYDLTDNNTVGVAAGKIGNSAYLINANTEYLSNASGPSAASAPLGYTISLWFKPLASANQYAHHGDYASGRDTYLYIRSSDYVQFRYISSADATANSPVSSVNIGEWNHAVGWWDPADGKSRVQVNGGTVGVSSSSSSQIESAISTFELGISISTTTDYIDLAGVWNRVLTAAERTELYNAGKGKHQGNALALTDNNTVGYTASGKSGNAAAMLTANSEYLSNAALAPDTGELTISYWLKQASVAGLQYTAGKGSGTSGWYSTSQIGGIPQFYFRGGSGNVATPLGPAPASPTGTWNHIVATIKPGEAYVYTNSTAGTKVVPSGALNVGPNEFRVGATYAGATLNGDIDEFAIWDRALSTAEVTALYASGAGRFHDFQE